MSGEKKDSDQSLSVDGLSLFWTHTVISKEEMDRMGFKFEAVAQDWDAIAELTATIQSAPLQPTELAFWDDGSVAYLAARRLAEEQGIAEDGNRPFKQAVASPAVILATVQTPYQEYLELWSFYLANIGNKVFTDLLRPELTWVHSIRQWPEVWPDVEHMFEGPGEVGLGESKFRLIVGKVRDYMSAHRL